jgi:hypothetical protein
MEKALTIILANGGELVFDPGTRVNFSKEQLRVSIDTPKKAAGIHTDRFATMVQVSANDTAGESENVSACTIELELTMPGEKVRTIEMEQFQTASVDAANNLMTFRGKGSMTVVNLDYLKYYRIGKGGN